MSTFDKVLTLFENAACRDTIILEKDGYLNLCVVNTYVYAIPVVLVALWAAATAAMRTDGRPVRSTAGNVKMLLTAAYVVGSVHFGRDLFNVISISASRFSLLLVFVLSYMDLNGYKVSAKALEIYYWVSAGAFGYMVMKLVTSHLTKDVPAIQASLALCLLASVNATARNIIEAIEPAPSQKAKAA